MSLIKPDHIAQEDWEKMSRIKRQRACNPEQGRPVVVREAEKPLDKIGKALMSAGGERSGNVITIVYEKEVIRGKVRFTGPHRIRYSLLYREFLVGGGSEEHIVSVMRKDLGV